MLSRARLVQVAILFVVVAVWCLPALAQPVNDASLLSDDFLGDALDSNNWNKSDHGADGGVLTVGDGVANFFSLTGADPDVQIASVPSFDYGDNTEWGGEVRFRINPGGNLGFGNRQFFLFMGNSTGPLNARDFDIRLLQASDPTKFDLAWHGYDVDGIDRVATPLPGIAQGLAREEFHTVSVAHRQDNTVDIYVNGEFAATMPSIVGPQGFEKPSKILIGDGSGSVAVDLDIDYVRYGFLVPEGIPGDVNGDEEVDMDDFDIIRVHYGFGRRRDEGNLDGRGVVDLNDFILWHNAFHGGAPVPEPAAAALALIGGVLMLARRRRRG